MLMVIFLPRRVPGEWTRRGAELCRDPEQGAARLDGPQLLRQWVGARQQQRRGKREESVIVGQGGQVMSGTQGPPRPPVIIHTLAPTLLYYPTNTAAHNNLSPPSPPLLNLSNVMMTTSSDGQINGHGLEWMLVRWGRRISGGVHLWTKLILFPSPPFRACRPQHFPH